MVSDDEIIAAVLAAIAKVGRGEDSLQSAGADLLTHLFYLARPQTRPGEIGN